ncbi:MAG: CPBP family intramembrane metalloprotease, partial [Lachnospiraceae bacterium]|nr:CPBP family intramembrane metalloprotease [Lachnospiraceae bacterium]
GSMYIPFLAVLTARIPLAGMGWMPHLKGKVRWIFFSLWVPALLALAGALLYFLIFPGQFDGELNTLRASMGEETIAMMESQGMTLKLYVITTSVAALTYAPFMSIITSIGEEVGWRGALYPYLKEHFGKTKGRVIGGIIWGAWHWPIMILAGYEYGLNYVGAPVLGLIAFCCCTVFMGILHDHVYEKTGLIWMPALFHGAVNAWTIYAYLLKEEYMDRMIFGPHVVGLISMIPMAALAVAISLRERNKDRV